MRDAELLCGAVFPVPGLGVRKTFARPLSPLSDEFPMRVLRLLRASTCPLAGRQFGLPGYRGLFGVRFCAFCGRMLVRWLGIGLICWLSGTYSADDCSCRRKGIVQDAGRAGEGERKKGRGERGREDEREEERKRGREEERKRGREEGGWIRAGRASGAAKYDPIPTRLASGTSFQHGHFKPLIQAVRSPAGWRLTGSAL